MTPRRLKKHQRRMMYYAELIRRSRERSAQFEQLRAEWAAKPVALAPLTFIGWIYSVEQRAA